jgi:hypothetical protein
MGFDDHFKSDDFESDDSESDLYFYVNEYWGHHFRSCPDHIGLEKRQVLAALLKFNASLHKARAIPPWIRRGR